MEKQILFDKNIYPTDDLIFSIIGNKKNLWENLFSMISSEFPEINSEWRYYNDGKSWLMKVTKKAKTIFWLSLYQKTFRITFYFGEKAEAEILNTKIDNDLKNQYTNGQRFGKIRAISIIFSKKKDIENVKSLIELKQKIK
ncbi:MAG: DUF3788 family protein [Ignavibacteriae bacterium]|nr:DUF3788 family protein [Ignavibacteriota bacterium]